jgi:Short C-terminal domain
VPALASPPAWGYREGVSLRRLRYQLRCAASGHDTRPHLVGGARVEHRCLRCGALVGDPEPAASTVHGPRAPDPDDGVPQLAGLPPTLTEPERNGGSAADPAEAHSEDDDDALTALQALRELGELHAAGVLTDAEFAVKKAELLRRV